METSRIRKKKNTKGIMRYLSQLVSRRKVLSFSPFSSFHRRTKQTEDAVSSEQPEQEHPSEGQGGTERQPTAGPRDGSNLQLNDLLTESFRNVRAPPAETNEDGEVVVDRSVCYDMDCRICEPMHECQALLRTLERVLTDSDGPFGFHFGRDALTAVSDSSSVEASDSPGPDDDAGRVPPNLPPAGRKERQKGKRRSKAKGGNRHSSGWTKLRTHLSQLFPYKSAPELPTRNESPLAEGATQKPGKPRVAKGFARLRRARRKPTVDV